MKLLYMIAMLTISISILAQVPQGINYQAIAVSSNGDPIANQNISIRASFLDGSSSGTSVYSETHQMTTGDGGLFTLKLGTGTVQSGDFSSIDWSTSSKFLRIELDENGGSNFTTMGTMQLLTVPYAYHAKTVENPDDADADPTNEIELPTQSGNDNGKFLQADGTGNVVFADDNVDDADADPTNEIELPNQVSTDNGKFLQADGNGDVVFADDNVNDADADPTNEIQNISTNDTPGNVTITDGATITLNVQDADADATNEIQNIETDNTPGNISISNGATITLNVEDGDADSTNEIELPTQSGAENGHFLQADGIGNVSYQPESQDLFLDGSNLKITGGTASIDISNGVNTDNQNISFDGTDLSITGGNSVDISSLGDDADADPANELLTNAVLNGSNLELTDAGGNKTVDLSGLQTENAWAKGGNDITDANAEFIGTSSENDFKIFTNNTERINVTSDGKVGVGTPADVKHDLHLIAETSPTAILTGSAFAIAGGYSIGSLQDVTGGNTPDEGHIGQATIINGTDGTNYGFVGLSSGNNVDANRGVFGVSMNANDNRGVYGYSDGGETGIGTMGFSTNGNSLNIGVLGRATESLVSYGGYFEGFGTGDTNYGIFATASGATENFAGYFDGEVVIHDTDFSRLTIGASGQSTIASLDLNATDAVDGQTDWQIFNDGLNNLIQFAHFQTGNRPLTITSDGEIGINTDSPLTELDVNGSVNIEGGLYFNALLFLHSTGFASNTFLGTNSGSNASNGDNTSLGYYSGSTLTTGFRNTMVGPESAESITEGVDNTFIGAHSGELLTTGSSNVMVGSFAGGNATGSDNTFIGMSAGLNNTNVENTFIGRSAGLNNSIGRGNVMVGHRAGEGNLVGSDNVFIGNFAGFSELGSNKLYIENSDSSDPLIYGEFDNDLVRVNGSVNITEVLKLKPGSEPSSPEEGDMYFDSTTKKLRVWDGTQWQDCF